MQTNTTPHLGDAELLHLTDRDASAWEMDVWGKHVLACEECAARLAERQRASAAVSGALKRIQIPAGFPTAAETMAAARARRPRAAMHRGVGRGRSHVALRAAAAVVLLALPLVLVSPVRAAVVEWLRQGWTELASLFEGDTPGLESIPAPAESAAPTASYTVTFTPAGSEVVIALAERQRAGRIVLSGGGTAEASLEVSGGGDESPLVTDAGVRIDNAASSSAVYRIELPATVRRARVTIAGKPAVELSAEEVARGWSYDFAGDAP